VADVQHHTTARGYLLQAGHDVLRLTAERAPEALVMNAQLTGARQTPELEHRMAQLSILHRDGMAAELARLAPGVAPDRARRAARDAGGPRPESGAYAVTARGPRRGAEDAGLTLPLARSSATALACALVLAGSTVGCHLTASSPSTTSVGEAEMKVWFEGEGPIACQLSEVAAAYEDLGALYVGLVSRMPGLSEVTLVEQGDDSVVIRTNEGLMTRSNITVQADDASVVVEFDEVYEAGSMVTTRSHYRNTYTTADAGVLDQLVISGVEAPGVLGFLYRSFGHNSIGNAVLASNKGHFEGT
jgi:hypothetical protein